MSTATAFFPGRARSRYAAGTPILFPNGCAAFPFAAPIKPGEARIMVRSEPQDDGRLLVVLADGTTGFLPGDPGTAYVVPEPTSLASLKIGSRLLVLKDQGGFTARFMAGQEVFVYRLRGKTNAACKLAGEDDLPYPADRKDWLVMTPDVVMALPDFPAK